MVGMWVRSDNHIEPVYTKVAKIRDNVLGCGVFAAVNQHIHAVRFNKRAISLPNVDIMHGNFSLGGKPARCFGKSGKIIYIFPRRYKIEMKQRVIKINYQREKSYGRRGNYSSFLICVRSF